MAVLAGVRAGIWGMAVPTLSLLVHDESRDDPGLAFQLSRLSHGPYEPTPVGVFRAVERPEYGGQVTRQLAAAQEQRGPGDLATLLGSGGTWEV